MPNKLPRSPFTTHLSGSARETELRLRNIFQWKKQRPPVVLIILTALTVLLCCGLVSCQPAQEPDTPADTAQEDGLSSPSPPGAVEELIASVSLAGAEPVPVPQTEPDTVSADTMGEILCDKALPDGTRVVCYWEPGSAYTKYWAIRQGDSLLRFLQEDSSYTEGYDVDTFTDVLGHDGFRILAPRGAAYYAYDYYTLDADGVPQLLAGCANPVLETDADGDGETELISFYHGGQDIIYYFRRDGQVFQAVVTGLLQNQSGIQAWAQEAESWTDGCFPVSWRLSDPGSAPSDEIIAHSGVLRFTEENVELTAAGAEQQSGAVPGAEFSFQDGIVYIKYAGSDTWQARSSPVPAPASWAGQDLAGRNEAETLVSCEHWIGLTSSDNGWFVASVGAGIAHADTYVYRTHDGGRTWEETGRPEEANWYPACVAFLDDDHAIIGFGTFVNAPIYRTEDGGKTWIEITGLPLSDGIWQATSITYDGDTVTMSLQYHDKSQAGPDAVFYSEDYGAHWSETAPD